MSARSVCSGLVLVFLFIPIALIVLHLLAITVYALRGNNLVRPMLSGDKHLPSGESVRPAADGFGRRLTALIVLALAAALVWWVVSSAPPPAMSF